jgi:hypothetical protein
MNNIMIFDVLYCNRLSEMQKLPNVGIAEISQMPIARQCHGKHVSPAVNMHTAIGELLEGCSHHMCSSWQLLEAVLPGRSTVGLYKEAHQSQQGREL